MASRPDPYAVLGVGPEADQAEIHAAYRAAVRRTHPDAGGTAAAFEAVQEAYEALRDAPRKGAAAGRARRPRPAPAGASRPRQTATPAGGGTPTSRMEAILAESRRLEDEARRLAGLPPRHDAPGSAATVTADTVGAILRDAGDQLREAADTGARELRRRLRRFL